MQEYARRARFYGLRKGKLLGRSMWAVGCFAQFMVGSTSGSETVTASPASDYAILAQSRGLVPEDKESPGRTTR